MFICASQLVMKRSSSPSLSKSPASMPMLASALPLPFTAAPDRNAVSLNVPFFWLIQSWFGCAVVADVDVDPAVAVEVGRRDAERRTVGAADERARVTSSNVPLPRLRYSRSGCAR